MRDYIVEQMDKGISLEDIHIAVEKIFNEEYNKREKAQKEVAAAFDRAVAAMTDYLTLATGLDIDEEIIRDGLARAEEKAFNKAKGERIVIKVKENELDDEDKALFNFLLDMGLIKPVK